MNQKGKVIAGCGIIVLAIGAYMLGARLTVNTTASNTVEISPQTATENLQTSLNNTVLQNQITVLKQEIIGLKTEIQHIKGTLAQKNSNEISKTNLNVDSPTKLQHASRSKEQSAATESARELGLKLDQQFRQQTTDKDWSEQTQTAIKNALISQKIPEADVIGIECRLDSCRIELANDSYNNPPDISELPFLLGQKLSQLIVDNRNSYDELANTTVVYLSNQPLSE